MEKWPKLLPRERVLVQYSDDPRLYHLRYVLATLDRPQGRQVITAVSPDRDVFELEIGPNRLSGVWRWPGHAVPKGVKKSRIYDDKCSADGAFTVEELEEFFRKYAGRDSQQRPLVEPAPVRVRVRSKAPEQRGDALPSSSSAALNTAQEPGAGDEGGGLPVEQRSEASVDPPDTMWVVIVPGASKARLGDTMCVPEEAVRSGGYAMVPDDKGIPLVLRRVTAEEVNAVRSGMWGAFKNEFREEWGTFKKEFKEELLKENGKADGTAQPGGLSSFKAQEDADPDDDGGGAATSGALDCRILPIILDESGERWRTIEGAMPSMAQQDFDDWPLESVRSSRFLLRELRRCSKTYLTSHTDWVKNSGVRSGDRAIHEHRVLSKALELAVSYDQLSVINLACLEVLVKRRMLIESAYEGSPEAPKWEGSEHFMGYRDSDSGAFVDQQALKHRATRMKQDMEVLREHRLEREEDSLVKKGGRTHGPKGGQEGG